MSFLQTEADELAERKADAAWREYCRQHGYAYEVVNTLPDIGILEEDSKQLTNNEDR